LIFIKLEGFSAKRQGIGLLRFIFLTKIGVDRVHNSVDWAWSGSPWTNGGGSARSHQRAAKTTLRLIGPPHEELGSKREMRGTHSRGLWGTGGAGKGISAVAVASGETTMEKALGSKGKEGRWASGGVVEVGGGARGLFIGAGDGELGHHRWW
jgi:hypothetical protein